jgi:hypothetical protein
VLVRTVSWFPVDVTRHHNYARCYMRDRYLGHTIVQTLPALTYIGSTMKHRS